MDGKLLILCDEMPGTHSDGHKEYKIRDSRFLAAPMIHPEDDTDRIFVSWDSIIPEDRAFIEQCKHYARFTEKPEDPLFSIQRRGSTDPADGTLKDSVQEASYYDTFERNFNYLYSLMKKGEDWYGEAMELGVQYPLDADERFFSDLVKLIKTDIDEGLYYVLKWTLKSLLDKEFLIHLNSVKAYNYYNNKKV